MSDVPPAPRDAARPAPPALAFERVRLRDVPEVLALARAGTDPRIASYALDPPAGARRARLKGWLSELPWIGRRFAQPERWFWVVSAGRRAGFVQLCRHGEALHLEFVVLAPELRGTGAAGAVLRFIDAEARAAGCRRVDLYVDRRNYRAYHLYRRAGFSAMPERRFVFEVPRSAPPSLRALAAVPRHSLAAVFGAIAAPAPAAGAGGHVALQEGRVAALSFDAPVGEAEVDAAVREVLRGTLARAARVTLACESNVRGGRLVAVLHRMEKVLG